MQFSTENTYRRLTRNDFQAFIHSPHAMVLATEYDDLTLAYRSHAWDWDVVGGSLIPVFVLARCLSLAEHSHNRREGADLLQS